MEYFLSIIQDPKTGAMGVLALWLWAERRGRLDEREERRKLQDERDQLLERVLNGLTNGTTALKSVVDAQNASQSVLSTLKDLFLSGRINRS
jgi:hypothetical protein